MRPVKALSRMVPLLQAAAAGPMALRAAIVGVNFAVMLGLAALLGLGSFGALAFLWGITLLLGTLVSMGGPLALLRMAGCGLRQGVFWMAALPLCVAVVLYWPLAILFPEMPWPVILAGAVGVNASTCLASILRGMGSVGMSMALRDGAPQVLLAVAALLAGGDIVTLLGVAAGLMALLCLVVCALVWGKWQDDPTKLPASEVAGLWGSTVLGVAVAQMDLIIGGLLFPPEVLGLYALLRRVANLVALPVSVATWVSAGPIAVAARAGDLTALQRASADGSRIAIISGGALFVIGLLGVAALPWAMPPESIARAQAILTILLCGALVQVCLAAGFPVATLCERAGDAAAARCGVVALYLAGIAVTGGVIGIVAHAALYALALSAGSLWLWHRMHRCFGVDTSACALWQAKAVSWRV